MGKGSKRRPVRDQAEFDENWDYVFKRSKKNEERNRYKRGGKKESK